MSATARSRASSFSSISSGRHSLHDVVVRRLSFTHSEAPELAESLIAEPVIETSCSSLVNPEHEGWLTKQGGTGLIPKNWRRRWFVLKGSAVYYYKQPEDAVALGCFSLRDALVMPPQPKKSMHNKFGFKVSVLHPKKRSYYFCADSASDMKSWMNAMSLAAIQYKPREERSDEVVSRKQRPSHSSHTSSNYLVAESPDFPSSLSHQHSEVDPQARLHRPSNSHPLQAHHLFSTSSSEQGSRKASDFVGTPLRVRQSDAGLSGRLDSSS